MKQLKALICLMAITMSFASCNDDDSDDSKKLSAEDLLVTNTVMDAVDKAVDDALNPGPETKISGINAKILKAGDSILPYSNEDGSLKLTGTRLNMVITLTKFSTSATDENQKKHTLVMSGELKSDITMDHETHTQTEKRTGSVAVTFDGVDHSIIFDLTVTKTHSEAGEDSVIEGTVTFDGTKCEY